MKEEEMANHHRRSTSIPTIRLSQPLPPLPLEDLRPRNVPQITIIPYRDDPMEGEYEPRSPKSPKSPDNANLPPSYEPMYDYLRSQRRPLHLIPPSATTVRISSAPVAEEAEERYRDDPFVVTIDHDLSQPPPPSYEELYIEDENQRQLQSLARELDLDSSPAEDVCKFMLAMLLLVLTVGAVGTTFQWGKDKLYRP